MSCMQNHVARIGCAIAPVGNKTGIVGGEAPASTMTTTRDVVAVPSLCAC